MPRVKLEFVKRYCPPRQGWQVCVDIDASEEGRTGGARETPASHQRQLDMMADAPRVRQELALLNVTIGTRRSWFMSQNLPPIEGDPDIIAFDRARRRALIVEVEGASSGQPEQKLYKAVGQIVRSASNLPERWKFDLAVVVYGERIAAHLARSHALSRLGVSGLSIEDNAARDRWLFGPLRDATTP
jgi:hypothetical protein